MNSVLLRRNKNTFFKTEMKNSQKKTRQWKFPFKKKTVVGPHTWRMREEKKKQTEKTELQPIKGGLEKGA